MWAPLSTLNYSRRVAFADAYGDGTVTFTFEDSEGRRATVCIDGRKGSLTRNRLFDQAKHPNSPEAVLLELGAVEEGLIVPLISKWLDSGEPRKQEFTEFGQELIRNAVLRLGEPIVGSEVS